MKKYKYNINNLDCANCARKIEEDINKNKDIKNALVNFNTSKITFESEKEFTLKELNELVKRIEPDSSVTVEEVKQTKEYHLSILIIALIISLIPNTIKLPIILKNILYVISYILLLYKTALNTLKLLVKNKTINENFLITISCIGAFIVDKKMEGIMVIALYTIGKILEEKALNNSRKSIKDLMDIKQPYANKVENNKTIKTEVENVTIGDTLIVKKGEKIPVDGIVIKGESTLDTSALTGESEPVLVKEQSNVLSGSVNIDGVIYIKATNTYNTSTVAKILDLLESATDKKTKTETTINKISKVYTPTVLILAILVIILLPLISEVTLKESIYRGLTFLVISCPCAIAISIPLSYFTGIGISSKNGILIKGSNYLDNLENTKNIIFDKTGTLTNGTFKVERINIIDKSYTKEEVTEILRKGESLSTHPIAKSIMELSNKKITTKDIKDFKEHEGKGITFKLNNQEIKIGNKKLCNCKEDATLHLNINDKHIASITINDGIKNEAKETIKSLQKENIKIFMFTGDKKSIAEKIGKELNIDSIKYEMLPTDKFNEFEKIAKKDEITIFVGDGINDAPVLKRADIGISMGGGGTDSAIEASDIVIMKDDLSKIPLAINISKYTKKIIKQNLILAIGIKIIILILSIFGLANMWLAVFADTGVTLLTILNTLKIINKYKLK